MLYVFFFKNFSRIFLSDFFEQKEKSKVKWFLNSCQCDNFFLLREFFLILLVRVLKKKLMDRPPLASIQMFYWLLYNHWRLWFQLRFLIFCHIIENISISVKRRPTNNKCMCFIYKTWNTTSFWFIS